jgi:hypothetical protein
MASEGPNNAGTCVNDASFGVRAWTQVTNAEGAINSTFATTGSQSGTVQCQYLKATAFGFAIPAGATIDGIQVDLQRKLMGTNCSDVRVRIVKGGVIGSTEKSLGAQWPDPVALDSFGGASDLWGETWTPADINAADFGAVVAPQIVNFTSGQVDAWEITVFFTEADGLASSMTLMRVGS